RITADLVAREAWQSYRDDPVLSLFPVPRVTISDVNIRLRFAIAGQAGPDISKADLTNARNQWGQLVAREVLPEVYAKEPGQALDAGLVKQLRTVFLKETVGDDVLRVALLDNPSGLVADGVARIVAIKSKLPAASQRQLPNVRIVRVRAERQLKTVADGFLARTRKTLEADAAAKADLDVLVTERDLQEIPAERIHEITFTIASDDVVVEDPSATDARRKEDGVD
ncbi:MAG: hypothetical protein MI755_17020, partial [Sphingomonadales bacterium]|nr:hypothetical protein [Sphingomonadales bacterium]